MHHKDGSCWVSFSDVKEPHVWLVKCPEQQSEKIRKSRQRAAGSLQMRDTNILFLPVPVSLPVCFLFLCLLTSLSRLATSAAHDVHWSILWFWEGGMNIRRFAPVLPQPPSLSLFTSSASSISVVLLLLQCRVSTVIPVVPPLPGERDRGKLCLLLFWLCNGRHTFF